MAHLFTIKHHSGRYLADITLVCEITTSPRFTRNPEWAARFTQSTAEEFTRQLNETMRGHEFTAVDLEDELSAAQEAADKAARRTR